MVDSEDDFGANFERLRAAEADTIAKLEQLPEAYEADPNVARDTEALHQEYKLEEARYTYSLDALVDTACRGDTFEVVKKEGSPVYAVTATRVDADLTDQGGGPDNLGFDYVTNVTVTLQPGEESSYTSPSLDRRVYKRNGKWNRAFHGEEVEGKKFRVLSVTETKHRLHAVDSNDDAGARALTYRWEGGERPFVVSDEPFETHEVKRLPTWEAVAKEATDQLQQEKVQEVLASTDYGQQLEAAMMADKATPLASDDRGDYAAYEKAAAEIMERDDVGNSQVRDRVKHLRQSLYALDTPGSASWAMAELMKPNVIETARLALLWRSSYASEGGARGNEILTNRLQWIVQHAPRLQADVYKAMADDHERRGAIIKQKADELAAIVDTADQAYKKVTQDTIGLDDHWEAGV